MTLIWVAMNVVVLVSYVYMYNYFDDKSKWKWDGSTLYWQVLKQE